MRIGCLTRYAALGASSRVRFEQYLEPLTRLLPGSIVERQALLDDDYLQRKYARRSTLAATLRGYRRRAAPRLWREPPDLWWVEKELWPYAPAALECRLLRSRPYVLDLDDAIFHNYDLHRSALVRRLYARKIDRLMRGAALVAAGNAYLAQRARDAGARRVEILPTVIDLRRYPLPSRGDPTAGPVVIGWVGSPATTRYLGLVAGPLQRLARRHELRLAVLGGEAGHWPGVDAQSLPWSAATEAEAIARFDIGIMPLPDSPWERGKCGYKLIQYMACGLPVVASPVGVNTTLVREGENGFLAANDEDWFQALSRLVGDAGLRRRLGAAGRRVVEAEYCVQVTAPRLGGWLQAVAANGA